MDELTRLTEGSEDELVNELLDNDSPFFFLSGNDDDPFAVETNHFSSMDPRLVSTLYSGPTIKDVESSLSDMNSGIHSFQHEDRPKACRISELGGMSNGCYYGKKKCILRIKNHENAISDDGYTWRKYGQKSIKNSPNPRSYYRCAKAKCNAKKRVERSMEDPDTLIITYEGLHVHLDDPLPFPATKKRKRPRHEAQTQAHQVGANIVNPGATIDPVEVGPNIFCSNGQGLLEDIVPFMIRNPWII